METIKAIKLVKEKLEVKTVLGVSNVSFGLPRREILNRTFLSMALYAGLDLPIMNTGDEGMKEVISSFEVLSNIDREGKNYVEKYGTKLVGKKRRSSNKY